MTGINSDPRKCLGCRKTLITQNIRFQGQYFDAESGLHYNRHRYYDPTTGRYITQDPIGLAGGLNSTQYVKNPTGWVDPLGLTCIPGNCPPKSETKPTRTLEQDGPVPVDAQAAAQRQARIDELAEANAGRILKEKEAAIPRAHAGEKHGAQTSLQDQYERADKGINPTTKQVELNRNGDVNIPPAATRYFSARDQLNAINRAELIFKNTGKTDLAKVPVKWGKNIGEGYQRGTLKYGQQKSTQTALNNQGKPITSFPLWGE